jgi:hypothetical protein
LGMGMPGGSTEDSASVGAGEEEGSDVWVAILLSWHRY